MKLIIIKILKHLFRFDFFRKRYFGIVKRLNQRHFFDEISLNSVYDKDIKISLNLDDWLQQQIYFLGIYEATETQYFVNNIEANTIFYDIGANIGYYTMLAAKRTSNGQVYAFEPDHNNREQLIKNIELNGFKNITIVPKIVAQVSHQTANLYIADKQNRGMTSTEKPANFTGKIEQESTISIDDFILKNSFPNLIKIDAEGSEYKILQGMATLMSKQKADILIEINTETLKTHHLSILKVGEFIAAQGYEFYEILETGKIEQIETIKESSLSLIKPKLNISRLI